MVVGDNGYVTRQADFKKASVLSRLTKLGQPLKGLGVFLVDEELNSSYLLKEFGEGSESKYEFLPQSNTRFQYGANLSREYFHFQILNFRMMS